MNSSQSELVGVRGFEPRVLRPDTPQPSRASAEAKNRLFWRRYERIVRLQRDHHDHLSASGRRFMARVRGVTFSDWADVRREASR